MDCNTNDDGVRGAHLVPEGVVIGKFPHLVRGGQDQAFLIVAEIHRPQTSKPVQDPDHVVAYSW